MGYKRKYLELLADYHRLLEKVQRDDLTGLLRRDAFLSAAKTAGAIIMVDIDHFKRINDNHGHPTGDAAIKAVSALLKKFPGVAGRWGGEEFILAVDAKDAASIAEFIRRGAENLGGPVPLTVSVGVSLVTDSIEGAIDSADKALYASKQNGRNKVTIAA